MHNKLFIQMNLLIPAVRAKERKLSKRDAMKRENFLAQPFCLQPKNTDDSPAPKRPRTSNDTLIIDQVNHSSEIAAATYASLLKDCVALQEQLRAVTLERDALKAKEKKDMKRRLQQECTRARNSANLWRKKYFDFRGTISVTKEVKRLKSCLSTSKNYYKTRLEEAMKEASSHAPCRSKERESSQRIQELEYELDVSKEKLSLEMQKSEKIQAMQRGRYTPDVRRAIYEAIQAQCPVSRAGELMNSILKILVGQDLSHVPSPVTVSRMVKEMGTIADLQTVESILTDQHCALGWDSTPMSGSHVNEIHVAVKPEATGTRTYHTLSIAGLPGGKTADYADHITVREIPFKSFISQILYLIHRVA
jgi:hypothetical protein